MYAVLELVHVFLGDAQCLHSLVGVLCLHSLGMYCACIPWGCTGMYSLVMYSACFSWRYWFDHCMLVGWLC